MVLDETIRFNTVKLGEQSVIRHSQGNKTRIINPCPTPPALQTCLAKSNRSCPIYPILWCYWGYL